MCHVGEEDTARRMGELMPPGRAHVCMDTAKLPVRTPISHDHLRVKVDVLMRCVYAVVCCDPVSLSSRKSLPTLSAVAPRKCEELELLVINTCDGCYRGRSLGYTARWRDSGDNPPSASRSLGLVGLLCGGACCYLRCALQACQPHRRQGTCESHTEQQ